MGNSNFLKDKKGILKRLDAEEMRIRKTLKADSGDIEQLKSDWQERDSPAERNLRAVEWEQYSSLQEEFLEIEAAKKRLEAGIYGICEDCEEEIPEKRLLAVLTATKCIACKEKAEAKSGDADRLASL